jgi:hypothetical protein
LNEAQATVILEAMKKEVSSGTKSNLASQLQGVNTSKSAAFQVDYYHRMIEGVLQKELDNTRARLNRAEDELGSARAVLAHREHGLEAIQRIAEAGGLIISDRDDMESTYRRAR